MKEVKILHHQDTKDFENEINEYLTHGYRVLEGSYKIYEDKYIHGLRERTGNEPERCTWYSVLLYT